MLDTATSYGHINSSVYTRCILSSVKSWFPIGGIPYQVTPRFCHLPHYKILSCLTLLLQLSKLVILCSTLKMSPLLTPYEIRNHLAEPHTLIHVRNLQTTLPIGTDAWGRTAKQQPVLITCIVSLRQPFSSAVLSDTVTKATVHYGILSKSILEACKQYYQDFKESKDEQICVRDMIDYIHWYLTGLDLMRHASSKRVKKPIDESTREPLLSPSTIHSLSLTIHLPKASLMGQGISLESICGYDDVKTRDAQHIPLSIVLKIHGLRIHTLVGVNDNERLAKQTVIANIDFEKWDRIKDCYVELEDVVVKVQLSSKFPMP
jgi:dihydroneopterin aldolase